MLERIWLDKFRHFCNGARYSAVILVIMFVTLNAASSLSVFLNGEGKLCEIFMAVFSLSGDGLKLLSRI